ncbi:MAG: restriction endonuclease subunit S [Paludibacteraceae bacterium]|nr:restriction endonuclease subunit S [Paludibacteraceae bacterium]
MNKKLGNIASIMSGCFLSEGADGNLLYLKVRDFTGNYIHQGDLRPSVFASEKTERFLLKDEDLLFAAKGNANFCYCYKESVGRAVASNAFFVIRVQDKTVLPEYVCCYMNQPTILNSLRIQARGTGIQLIGKDVLEKLLIPIPPMEVQQRICEYDKLRRKETELLEQIAQKKQDISGLQLMNMINMYEYGK